MNALAKILEWPVEPQDELGLALWDAVALARAMDGVAVGEFQVAGVEIDSRDVIEGDLFFALKGINRLKAPPAPAAPPPPPADEVLLAEIRDLLKAQR